MKLKLILLSAITACVLLTACNSEEESQAEPTYYQIVTDAPTEPTEPELNAADDYVKSANENFSEKTDGDEDNSSSNFSIPEIRVDTPEAKKINADIHEKYDSDIDNALSDTAADGKKSCDSISYDSYLNDDILSIVITRTYSDHSVDYGIYNYDVRKDQQLDNQSLCDALKREYSEVQQSLKNSLDNDYRSKFKYDNFPNDYYINYEKTLADDNLAQAMLFLDKGGNLTAICKEFATVGSGEFTVLLRVDTK